MILPFCATFPGFNITHSLMQLFSFIFFSSVLDTNCYDLVTTCLNKDANNENQNRITSLIAQDLLAREASLSINKKNKILILPFCPFLINWGYSGWYLEFTLFDFQVPYLEHSFLFFLFKCINPFY